ncbi:MAG: hypothetical protein FWF66_07150 [Candidatus Bathyarchaeota archaeon]|nr:hypothetical protein [Candidatus Termiticorpusculum sp.]MCL1971209.1 hypothetical protein [Candidatus Termiticorpusculum sp.]
MSKKVYLTLIVIVLIVASVAAAYYVLNTSSRPRVTTITAGVSVGDVFIYRLEGFADSHVDFSIPGNFVDINNTKYYRVEITKVDVPIVSFTVSWEFNNGTLHSYDGMINLENGLYSGFYWDIYAANLKAGDLSRPETTDEPKVNSTQTKTISGSNREINFLTASYEAYDPTDVTYTKMCYVYNYVYFDKQIGMMVAARTLEIYNSPEIFLTVEFNLVEYTLAGSDTVKIPASINFFS